MTYNDDLAGVKAAMVSELQELTKISKTLQTAVADSKTETKKKYYNKKLAKNNKAAMKMIIALTQVDGLLKHTLPKQDNSTE